MLVVAEVALALILLVGSALLIRTWGTLQSVDPGFDATNVVTMGMSVTGDRFARTADLAQLVRNGIERLETLPGVDAASATCCVPLQGARGLPFVIAGRPLDGPCHGFGGWVTASPGYFGVFRIPVRRGRAFTDLDLSDAPPSVVINEAMAAQFWPDGDPLADRLLVGRGVMEEFADEPERQIIGIVGDVRDAGLNNDPRPIMYVPQAQQSDAVNAFEASLAPIAWVVRTRTSPAALIPVIEQELTQVAGVPVSGARTMDDVVLASTSRQRFTMWLMTVFGGVALLLAAIGVYGLMAYSVAQRTQEIGIRLALGAEAARVRRMVVFQGMRLVAIGVVVGVAAAVGLTRVIASLLFGVEALDVATLVAVAAVLGSASLVAVVVPARRASRVDPVTALRYE